MTGLEKITNQIQEEAKASATQRLEAAQKEADAILAKEDLRKNEVLEKHADWVDAFLPKYDMVAKDNVMDIIQKEVGIVFGKVLEHAGVYKRDEAGRAAFQRFIDGL